jgi:PAS domain S-box-containing protein
MNVTESISSITASGEPGQPPASFLEARYEHLFAESFDVILITDLDGRVLEANRRAAGFFGTTPEKLKDVNLADLLAPAGLPLQWGQNLKGTAKRFSAQVRVDDGRHVTIHALRLPSPSADGDGVERVQWILHDSSAKAELEQAQQDLTAMLMHDLQSPLGNVISSLELIRNHISSSNGDSVLHSMLDIAMRSSNHLQTLIASLLDISRLEAGHPINEREPVNVYRLVESTYEIEQPNFEKRGVQFVNRVAANMADIYVEKSMISRVILNLLDNALKQSQENQQITIRAQKAPDVGDDGMILISVSDQGAGIPEAYRQMIFEKYARINNDSSSKGLGLGLAFCRLAVEAHGGRIWVDDAPEGGARFQFTVPSASEIERLRD